MNDRQCANDHNSHPGDLAGQALSWISAALTRVKVENPRLYKVLLGWPNPPLKNPDPRCRWPMLMPSAATRSGGSSPRPFSYTKQEPLGRDG